MNKQLNKSISLEGAKIFIRNLEMTSPVEFDMKHDFPFIKLHFVLKGQCHYEPDSDMGIPITINEGQYNFFYLPEVEGKLCLSSGVVSTVDIECEEVFIKRLFKNNFVKISGKFGEAMKARLPFKVWSESQFVSPFMESKLNEFINSTQKKEIDIVDLKNQLSVMFYHIFTQITPEQKGIEALLLRKEERYEVDKAEKILQSHLKKGITVEELAAVIGTNRHKLNRNFKKVYNEPIFSYLTQLRMTKAKILLHQKKLSISEVAYNVGYKNPQHFTVAFKKYYGYLPSKLEA